MFSTVKFITWEDLRLPLRFMAVESARHKLLDVVFEVVNVNVILNKELLSVLKETNILESHCDIKH